ncbi:hypothetical protein WJX77_002091 [Trebouxia sp. C0004]
MFYLDLQVEDMPRSTSKLQLHDDHIPMTVNEISFLHLQQSMILPIQLSALDVRCSLLTPLLLPCSWILLSKACTAA